MNKAVFLDRDGTINKEVNYLYKTDEFEFIEGAIDAIKIFRESGYKVIVVTNQAGIARGYYKEKDVQVLHNYLDKLLKENNTFIDAYYYCPHHPEGTIEKYNGKCNCRKPEIGMIEQAKIDFNIDLKESIIVGDKESDILTGKNAGIGRTILVRSGHLVDEAKTVADAVYDNLYEFAISLNMCAGHGQMDMDI